MEKSVNEVETFSEFAGQTSPVEEAIKATDKAIDAAKEFGKTLDAAPVKNLPAKARVEAGESGVLMPRDFEGAYRMATILCESKTLPAAFDTAAKVFAAMQLCYELGLTPMIGLRQMMVVNGTPAIWGDLPLSLVHKSGKLKSIKEWWFDKEGTIISAENKNLTAELYGATCVVERFGHEPVTRTFTMDDAKKAGLVDKNRSLWKVYPKRMIQCRVRSWALKDTFPDVLNGVAIAEYDHDTIPGVGDQDGSMTATAPAEKAASLNSRFGKKEEAIETEATHV